MQLPVGSAGFIRAPLVRAYAATVTPDGENGGREAKTPLEMKLKAFISATARASMQRWTLN